MPYDPESGNLELSPAESDVVMRVLTLFSHDLIEQLKIEERKDYGHTDLTVLRTDGDVVIRAFTLLCHDLLEQLEDHDHTDLRFKAGPELDKLLREWVDDSPPDERLNNRQVEGARISLWRVAQSLRDMGP